MRLLARNKLDIWYANRIGAVPIVDSDGFKTGDYQLVYSTPTKLRMSISASSGANNLGSQGMANLNPYGITTGYTHRATTEDMNCPITEESLIWFKIEPGATAEEVPHNFKIVRIARSLNHLIYYLKEVDVGNRPTGQTGVTGVTGITGITGVTGITGETNSIPEGADTP